MRKVLCITTVCLMLIAILLLSGCDSLQKLGFGEAENDELTPVSSIAMGEEDAQKLTDKVPIHLYFANEDNTKLKLEVRYIPVSEAKKSVNHLASVIVKELIKGPSEKSGLKATLPREVKLNKTVSIDSGVAIVDLSKEFITKHPGGKDAEKLTIYSISNSLTELKEVQKVKFKIDGKSKSEFKGGYKFDASFPRSTSLISKDVGTPIPSSTDGTGVKGDTKASPTPKSDKAASGTSDEAVIDEESDILTGAESDGMYEDDLQETYSEEELLE